MKLAKGAILTLVSFCLIGNAGAFGGLPWSDKGGKKAHEEKKVGEKEKKAFLFEYPAGKEFWDPRGILQQGKEVMKVGILGYFNDKCLVYYKGRRLLTSRKECELIRLKQINFIEKLLRGKGANVPLFRGRQ